MGCGALRLALGVSALTVFHGLAFHALHAFFGVCDFLCWYKLIDVLLPLWPSASLPRLQFLTASLVTSGTPISTVRDGIRITALRSAVERCWSMEQVHSSRAWMENHALSTGPKGAASEDERKTDVIVHIFIYMYN